MAVRYTKDLLRAEAAANGWEIGDYTYGLPKPMLWGNDGKLIIGRYCSIADHVTIQLGGNHRPDWVTTYPFSAIKDTWPEAAHITGHPATKGDVRIGSDVWLSQSSTIMSGVTIGDGAIVAASALVAKDVPPFAIVGGNPAKVIKYRFAEKDIESLLRVKWWDWPEAHVRSVVPDLASGDVAAFLRKAEAVMVAIRSERVADAAARAERAREAVSQAEIALAQARAEEASALAAKG